MRGKIEVSKEETATARCQRKTNALTIDHPLYDDSFDNPIIVYSLLRNMNDETSKILCVCRVDISRML